MIGGGGRTLINIADRIEDGSLPASVELVIASREDIPGVERARARGLDVRVPPRGPTGDDQITAWIEDVGADLVCLCGYLRLVRIDAPLVGRTINIHPALLPDFGGRGMYGNHVHRAVLDSGRTFSGCTVHVVDEAYDHGPILLQRPCPVLPGDDVERLAARVFDEECIAYPDAIRLIAEGRVRIDDGGVEILAR